MSFEDLVTSQNGVTASRALVNVVIDQQIGQQISVCPPSHPPFPPFALATCAASQRQTHDVAPSPGPRFLYRALFPLIVAVLRVTGN